MSSPKPDKIICLGKNYLEHAHELGDAVPDMPVLFLKPASVLTSIASEPGPTRTIALPSDRGPVHHECEIVLRLAHDLRCGILSNESAGWAAIEAVTLGLDLTLRDVQAALKKAGHPWEVAKVFDHSALVGEWIAAPANGWDAHSLPGAFSLDILKTREGNARRTPQAGHPSAMRVNPGQAVAYANRFFSLCAGDLIFTGTPAGVGPLSADDEAELIWDGRSVGRVAFR